eukprot:COSAG02_NODE_174_length_31243_cov_76.084543_18_plen_105_part_00
MGIFQWEKSTVHGSIFGFSAVVTIPITYYPLVVSLPTRNMIMRMHVTFDLRRIRMILRIQSSFHWIEKTFQNGTEFILKFPSIQNYPLILSGEGTNLHSSTCTM